MMPLTRVPPSSKGESTSGARAPAVADAPLAPVRPRPAENKHAANPAATHSRAASTAAGSVASAVATPSANPHSSAQACEHARVHRGALLRVVAPAQNRCDLVGTNHGPDDTAGGAQLHQRRCTRHTELLRQPATSTTATDALARALIISSPATADRGAATTRGSLAETGRWPRNISSKDLHAPQPGDKNSTIVDPLAPRSCPRVVVPPSKVASTRSRRARRCRFGRCPSGAFVAPTTKAATSSRAPVRNGPRCTASAQKALWGRPSATVRAITASTVLRHRGQRSAKDRPASPKHPHGPRRPEAWLRTSRAEKT